ncbi:MAG: alpha/beta hydrolase [Deltaproteobacteria bacterium]|nr:alpha/beta hydrolase [Deltaproteobacteria bacterium]
MEITVNGVTLSYTVHGSGDPVIALHGNGEDHHIFDRLVPHLATAFRVYAVDSRNHGRSQRVADVSYDAMTTDIHAFITSLDLAPVHILGFSDGAIIGLLLAIRQPDVVNRLALLGVNLSPDDFTPATRDWIRREYEKTRDPRVGLMLEEPHIPLDAVRRVAAPTLLVAGEHDLFQPEFFPRLRDAMPNARLRIMAGHTHDSYIIRQDCLAPDLLDFFGA